MPLIDLAQLRTTLGASAGRFDVDALDVCSSTNALLLERAAAGAPAGTVLVADTQTAGRGRRGRPWVSAPADSLTFSLLWRLPPEPERLAGLSLAVGLALVHGLESQGATGLGLKWPNDLLCARPQGWAKLAGVLVELATDRRGMQVVLGIGLNLRAPPTGGPLVDQVVAGLVDVCQSPPERHELLAALLQALVTTLERFSQQGFAPLRAEWEARHVWQNQPVRLFEAGLVSAEGICLGVDAAGALLLETGTGLVRCMAGDLSLRGAA